MTPQQNQQIPSYEKAPQQPPQDTGEDSPWDDLSNYQPGPEQLQEMGMAELLPQVVAQEEQHETMSNAEEAAIRQQILEEYNAKTFDQVLDDLTLRMQNGTFEVGENVIEASRSGNIDAIKALIDAVNRKIASIENKSGTSVYEHGLIIGKLNAKIQEIEKEKEEKQEENNKPEEETASNDSDGDGGDYDGGDYDGGSITPAETATDEPRPEEVKADADEAPKEEEKELNREQQKLKIIVDAAMEETLFNDRVYALGGRLPIDSAGNLLPESFKQFSVDQRIKIMTVVEEAMDFIDEEVAGVETYGKDIRKWFDKKLNNVKGDEINGTTQSLREYLKAQIYNDSLTAPSVATNAETATAKPNLRIVNANDTTAEGVVVDSVEEANELIQSGELGDVKPEQVIVDVKTAPIIDIKTREYIHPPAQPVATKQEQIDHLKAA